MGSSIAGVGAMLPDLWRLADRRMRARAAVHIDGHIDGDAALGELQRGVEHHLEADAWFHRTSVFVAGERECARALRASAPGAPKLGLFGHMCWEMCLDGALLMWRGLDREIASLRHDLEHSARSWSRVADAHGAEARLGSVARGRFERRMAEIRDGLWSGEWIAGYCDAAGLCMRLAGTRARFGLPPLSGQETSSVTLALDGCLRHAGLAVTELLDQRQRARVEQP